MNTLLILILAIPVMEIIVLIKIGAHIGALNTVLLIFTTAIIGIYFARLQGLSTLRAGFKNIYENRTPIYELFSGASIAIAAVLLIIPGFLTDVLGFTLLIPLTRNLIIKMVIKKNNIKKDQDNNDVIDGEVIEKEKDKDEL
tara:strand:- start:862 stop:1287 length:426 start_codon:yes stop_codon:yes gene_type:complete